MDAVVDTLTERLTALYEASTEEEQQVLDAFLMIVIHANLDEADVEGFGLRRIDRSMKGLEAQDRMGNFEIQTLMSDFNQAETLASSVMKRTNDARNSIIGKI